ncbi:MAG: succinate dehydrogenase cytochrome b subunit [Verrucomicrobiota bacterium]
MTLIQSSLAFWQSSIGKKVVVALTGAFLVFFLLGHLSGNLLIYAGPAAFNDYAYFLHHMGHGAGIWAFRIIFLAAIVAHIVATVQLTRKNRGARPSYQVKKTSRTTRNAQIMIWSGITILVFFVYHILHFTVRVGNEYNDPSIYGWDLEHKVPLSAEEAAASDHSAHNAWLMVVHGFQWWPASAFYVVGMTLLCSHLSHGIASIFQTLGVRSRKSSDLIEKTSKFISIALYLGFISIPIAILFGFVSA